MLLILTPCCQAKPTKSLLVPKSVYFWAALTWTFFIAVLCLISFQQMPSVSLQSADKYVHFIFHFVFTLLWYLYFKNKIDTGFKTIASVFLLSFLFGIVIEIAQQLLTVNRVADIYDVAANFSGAAAAVLVVLVFRNFLNKSRFLNNE